MPYCKNCGNEMVETAAVCVKCGTAKGNGNKFCSACGKEITQGTAFCMNCGTPVANSSYSGTAANGAKSKMVAGLLGIFLGNFGVHNFYLGNTGKAVAQLVLGIVTCGVTGIWGFIEGILILCGNINVDGSGNPLAN